MNCCANLPVKRLSNAAAVRDAHLNYYVTLTADTDALIHGRQQTQWLDRLEREHNNLCAAISWSLEQGRADSLELGLSLAASIWEFWLMRGHLSEGRQWLTLLLDATQGTMSERAVRRLRARAIWHGFKASTIRLKPSIAKGWRFVKRSATKRGWAGR